MLELPHGVRAKHPLSLAMDLLRTHGVSAELVYPAILRMLGYPVGTDIEIFPCDPRLRSVFYRSAPLRAADVLEYGVVTFLIRLPITAPKHSIANVMQKELRRTRRLIGLPSASRRMPRKLGILARDLVIFHFRGECLAEVDQLLLRLALPTCPSGNSKAARRKICGQVERLVNNLKNFGCIAGQAPT